MKVAKYLGFAAALMFAACDDSAQETPVNDPTEQEEPDQPDQPTPEEPEIPETPETPETPEGPEEPEGTDIDEPAKPACEKTVCHDETTLFVCQEGAITIDSCEYACENDACKPAPESTPEDTEEPDPDVPPAQEEEDNTPDESIEPDNSPECSETACNGDYQLYECSEGKLTIKTCQHGCTNNACASAPATESCKNLKCDYGCTNGKCWPAPEIVTLNKKKIMFTGNSLTHYGRCVISPAESSQNASVFKKIAEKNEPGAVIKMTNFTFGGAGHKRGRHKAKNDNMPTYYSNLSEGYGIYHLMLEKHPCSYNNKNKEVTTPSGKKYNCAELFKSDGYDKAFYNQDYVFLQQRSPSEDLEDTDPKAGTAADENTYKDALEIIELFPRKTEFIVMQTTYASTIAEYVPKFKEKSQNVNQFRRVEQLNYEKGLKIVPWGELINKLYGNKYSNMKDVRTYKRMDYIIADEKHPNHLTGYLTALGAYTALTGKLAASLPNTELNTLYGVHETYKYYEDDATITNYVKILKSSKEMKLIQAHLDTEFALYDNLLRKVKKDRVKFFGNMKCTNDMNALTDMEKNYDASKSSTYASFQWTDSVKTAQNWEAAPHFTPNGKTGGKYLGGFYYELPTKNYRAMNYAVKNGKDYTDYLETIYKFRLTIPNPQMEIDGFDILTSVDGQNWNVAYSETKLSCEQKPKKSPNYKNVNYLYKTFYPVKARYIMFALTQPRCQDATADEIKKYNEAFGTSVKAVSDKPNEFQLSEFEVFRYTTR